MLTIHSFVIIRRYDKDLHPKHERPCCIDIQTQAEGKLLFIRNNMDAYSVHNL